MSEVLRVGVIGANPTRGWAARSHLPALQALPEFDLRAVATTRQESADEAAAAFGAAHAFSNAEDLLNDPEVDVVAVCVKAPEHATLVRAAIEAGKHLYCEWPLGVSLAQAEELARLGEASPVRQAIGLQGRKSPTFNYLRDLVRDGRVGEVLAVSLVQNGSRGAREIHAADRWEIDRTNGATMLSVTAAHSIDALQYCLGPFAGLQATVAVRTPFARVIETGEEVPVTSPDVALLQGRLQSGAFITVNMQGGLPNARGARLEIRGSEGLLLLEADSNLQMNDATLRLSLSRGGEPPAQLTVPKSYHRVPDSVPEGNARNIAGVYLALADAIAGKDSDGPDFTDAVALHRLTDAIERAGESGRAVTF